MKLSTNIHHASGNCLKVYKVIGQGHVWTPEAYISSCGVEAHLFFCY